MKFHEMESSRTQTRRKLDKSGVNFPSIALRISIWYFPVAYFTLLFMCSEIQTSESKILVKRSITRLTRDDSTAMGSIMWNQPKIEMPVVPPFVKILRKEYRERTPTLSFSSSTESPLQIVEVYDELLEDDNVNPNSTFFYEDFYFNPPSFSYPSNPTEESEVALDEGSDAGDVQDNDHINQEGNDTSQIAETPDDRNQAVVVPASKDKTKFPVVNDGGKGKVVEGETSSQSNVSDSDAATDLDQSRSPKLIVLPTNAPIQNLESKTRNDAIQKFEDFLLEDHEPSVPEAGTEEIIKVQGKETKDDSAANGFPVQLSEKTQATNPRVNSPMIPTRNQPESSVTNNGGGGGVFQALIRIVQEKTKLITSTFTQLGSALLRSPARDQQQRKESRLEVYE